MSSTIAKPQLRPLQLVALVKDLKDFIILEYELAYYVSTCGLVGKAVDTKSGEPSSNPDGVNSFYFFFASLPSFFVLHTASIAASSSFKFPNSPVSAISRVKAFLCKIKGTKVVASHN